MNLDEAIDRLQLHTAATGYRFDARDREALVFLITEAKLLKGQLDSIMNGWDEDV